MTTASVDRGPEWLESFHARLLAPAARAFAGWAVSAAGPDAVLDRDGFGPETLKPWLGSLTILHRPRPDEEFRYRLFGSDLRDLLGRDLSGLSLSAWPDKVARVKRDRLHTVLARRIPVVAHTVRLHYETDTPRRGFGVLEQVMWPMRYGSSSPNAILDLTVPVPESAGVTAESLRRETGHLGRSFAADGAPLERSPGNLP